MQLSYNIRFNGQRVGFFNAPSNRPTRFHSRYFEAATIISLPINLKLDTRLFLRKSFPFKFCAIIKFSKKLKHLYYYTINCYVYYIAETIFFSNSRDWIYNFGCIIRIDFELKNVCYFFEDISNIFIAEKNVSN